MIIQGKLIRSPLSPDYLNAIRLAKHIDGMGVPFDVKISQLIDAKGVNGECRQGKLTSTVILKRHTGANPGSTRQATQKIKNEAKTLLGDKCKVLGFPHRFEIQVFG